MGTPATTLAWRIETCMQVSRIASLAQNHAGFMSSTAPTHLVSPLHDPNAWPMSWLPGSRIIWVSISPAMLLCFGHCWVIRWRRAQRNNVGPTSGSRIPGPPRTVTLPMWNRQENPWKKIPLKDRRCSRVDSATGAQTGSWPLRFHTIGPT